MDIKKEIENDTDLQFSVSGLFRENMIIEGKKLKIVLLFNENHLKQAVLKTNSRVSGEIVFAQVTIKDWNIK